MNSERGEKEIRAGREIYTFRLGLTALAKLQKLLSTPAQRISIPNLIARIVELENAREDVDLEFLLFVMLAGLQEFHATTIKTTGDVERVIEAAGGLEVLNRQLQGLSESLTPDPEDQKRREANPRKARAKKN